MEQLISANEVVKYCIPNKNFDQALIKTSYIESAELQHIKPVLTKDFWNEIYTQYRSDSLSQVNLALVNDYIKPALAFYVLHIASPFMMVQHTSAGIQINNTEFSTSASRDNRADVETALLKIADSFVDRLKNYIENNLTLFPLYDQGSNIDNNTSLKGGIILDTDGG